MTPLLPVFALLPTLAFPAAVDSAAASRDSLTAGPDSTIRTVAPGPAAKGTAPDTTGAPPRLVRTFPPVEVRALLPDLASSQTVHPIAGAVLRTFPVDNLQDVLVLQPGVVAQAEELHVRGGRAGETVVSLEGMPLNEPLRRRPMEVPLLALDRAELVSGTPDAQYGGGLAGVLELHTVNPGERASGEWRWVTDGEQDTHYERLAARAATPLPAFGLGLVAAADAAFDDGSLPRLRTVRLHDVAGIPLGWRADNRMLGFLKLAPVRDPERFSAQLVMSRRVAQPFSPDWSLDGWTYLSNNTKDSPVFSPVELPGYQRYRAADHLAMTDERQLAALAKWSTRGPRRHAGLGVGWLRTRGVLSVGGNREPPTIQHRPRYGKAVDRDLFHPLWGDYPLYRESNTDVLMARGDAEIWSKTGGRIAAGLGLAYDDLYMREMDWMPFAFRTFELEGPFPLDSLRAYRAYAPAGFAYVQTRWLSGGLILNAGLRLEYFTPGPQATRQTLPGSTAGVWSLGPRLGIAYPISTRDAFSFAYVRMQQPPARDYLYDQRIAISDRQPLGNPALVPATLVSYEAAVKHLFGPEWATQAAVFYRDVYDQIGALDYQIPGGTMNLRYANADRSHVTGFEWSVFRSSASGRIEAHYTWMTASGNESRPEGDPYGPVRTANLPPIDDQPVSWDRRHSLILSGAWASRHGASIAWATAVSSAMPWTPKPRRQPFTDMGAINTERLGWLESTNLDLAWTPSRTSGLTFGIGVRNLFDNRAERAVSVDGYPSPVVNTLYDDYAAYRTETGQGGGAYWLQLGTDPGYWVPVHDPRLFQPPRTIRAIIAGRW